ncbi:MAG: ribosome small subunit-dependent GTPase A [Eubacteriales bacterium]
MKGLVTKAISGFFYVETQDLNLIECKARGNLKNGKNKIKVGDVVELSEADRVISQVFPRKNNFIRPDVANVDSFLLVFSIKEPDLNLNLLDKFIVMSEETQTEAVICISKSDLASEYEIEKITKIYDKLYQTICFNVDDTDKIAKIEELIAEKSVALTGPSGSGKSTLTNLLLGRAGMQIGSVSEKTGRGKHTTRHSQIFRLKNGAKLFDTPGFTAFETANMNECDLKHCYIDFASYAGRCKYDNCNHINEPACSIVDAVNKGDIAKSRYDSYVRQFAEIAERNRKW